ncbi:MAG: threonine synthase [Conexivisphaerales archaeon]
MIIGLRCRECKKEFSPSIRYVCDDCFGALDVIYDYDSIHLTKDLLRSRENNMWRYKELLPVEPQDSLYSFHSGWTPLIKASKLAKALDLNNLYIKNDSVNPTFSFKDRPAALGVAAALNFGLEAVGCASTGNLAAATAAYAARAGLPCYVVIPSSIEQSKISQAQAYGATIIAVEGTYDDSNRLAAQAGEYYNIGMVNINLRPYYVEGSKTLAFEVAEQLGWDVPDTIVVPTASGAMLNAICRGFEELMKIGFVRNTPATIVAAQASGCNPISRAYKEGKDVIMPIQQPDTIAKSLAIGDPGDGIYVLRRLRNNGLAEDADDDEIIEGCRLLAQTEGIFTEPAGGVAIAVLKKLVEQGKIGKDDKIVCYITGNGLKAPDVLQSILPRPIVVKPELKALSSILLGG